MDRFSNILEQISRWVGERAKWLTTALVILIFVDVVLRYLFSITSAWVIELEWHLFALIFILGAAFTLAEDQHVRVDVFYTRFSPRRKAWVNLVGTILFLIPWCLIVIYTSYHYADNSFAVREISADPGGLPARYVIKFSVTVGFTLLLLQALSLCLKSIAIIIKKEA
ncbi:MAG: C4-dicarboxylate ABC transporter permease [Bacteroidetes bacterium]|nr:MAG: C4-dicarboxylate ABC transporter permease [Bacteroidota bacterium]